MSADNRTATPLQAFYDWERSQPDRVYLTQPVPGGGVVEYTWAEVGQQARRMAAWLRHQGYPEKSQIGLLGKNSAHWIIADLAIWMAGHVSVPLYPTLNADTVAYILEHSEAKLLFIGRLEDGDWAEMQKGIPQGLPCIRLPMAPEADTPTWDDTIDGVEPLSGEVARDPEEMATIVYTSGSTGRPKGVMLSFGAMGACAHGVHDVVDLNDSDRVLSYLPLAHVLERFLVECNSLRYGFQVFFADSLNTFLNDLRRARPTVFASVPRLWVKFQLGVLEQMPEKKQKFLFRIPILGRIVKKKILEKLGLENVRYAVTGSAPLSASTLAWYRSLGLELLEGYGMSENFGYSHGTQPGTARVGYVGQSAPGVETRIAENGEILVKSPGTMMGYFKDEEKTREAFTEDGFLMTGDMGEIDEAGRLKITGRVKELFKTSKGKYVAPVPIENKLANHPKVEVVCVAGANQTQPYCLVMLSEDAHRAVDQGESWDQLSKELEALIQETNRSLDPHEHVQFAVVVKEQWTIENGFLTPTMKIKRNVIEERYEPKVAEWYAAKQAVIREA